MTSTELTPAAAQTSLRLLYGYRTISRFYFHLPVLFVLFYGRDWSLPVIEVLVASYGAAVALSGSLGPRFTRALGAKRTVALGEACKIVGLSLLGTVSSVPAALAGQVLGGIGFCISTGPDAGLLVAIEPDPRVRGKLQASMQSWMFISSLVSGVIGAVIFSHSRTGVFFCSAVASAVSLLLILAIPVTEAAAGNQKPTAAPPAPVGTGWWSAYYIVGRVSTLGPFVGLLPFLYFVRLHVELAVLGVVLGVYTLSGFVSARYAGKLTQRLTPQAVAVTGLVGTGIGVALFGVFREQLAVALVATAILGLFSGCVRPMAMAGLGKAGAVPPVQAARAGRLEQLSGLVSTPVMIASGFLLADHFALIMIAIGAATVITGLVLFVLRGAAQARTAPTVREPALS